MSRKAKLSRFGRRYDFFLSDASNEEIVSISKELTDEMNSQVKLVNSTGLALLGISLFTLILTVMLISGNSVSVSGSAKSIIILLRILAIAFTCISALLAGYAVYKVMGASSISTMFWRHIRETADDEKVYEQMLAVRTLNIIVSTSKSNVRNSALVLVAGGIMVGAAFLLEMLKAGGYL